MISINNSQEEDLKKLAISINNLTVKYGETPALAGVSINIIEGDYLGIIGPNGGGKTTLLKSILGLVAVASGEITIYGRKPGKAGRLIGYVPQITNLDKHFPITVHEVVLTGRLSSKLSLFHRYQKRDSEIADELLNKVGIYKLRGRMISQLSGGEFQKMLIARALTVEPKLLLLDEPTASVDATSREQIFALLQEFNQEMTVILVTHDLLAISSHVKSLACLNERLVYHGGAELSQTVVSALYGCPIDLLAHGVPHRVLGQHEGERKC